MEEKNSFKYVKQFLDALVTVDSYEMKGTATYALCYYALTGELPDEATDADRMYVGAYQKMIEGQEDWIKEKSQEGAISGKKKQQLTDEELIGAIRALYQQLGRIPREPEILNFTHTTATVRKRDPWRDRNKICGENVEETKIVEKENKKCESVNFVSGNKNCGEKQKFTF